MGVNFRLNEIPYPSTRAKAEDCVREYLADRPEREDWQASIYAPPFADYVRVVLESGAMRRERLFFERPEALPAALAEWLRLYRFSEA